MSSMRPEGGRRQRILPPLNLRTEAIGASRVMSAGSGSRSDSGPLERVYLSEPVHHLVRSRHVGDANAIT